MNNVLVLCVTGVGIAFLVLLYTDYYRRAGIMEWIITYLGAFWLATFAGYIRCVMPNPLETVVRVRVLTDDIWGRFRENTTFVFKVDSDAERQPLLVPDP